MPTETVQLGIEVGTTLVGLIPVIIGGLLTAAGGFIGAYVSHNLGRTSARENLKREKLEALVQLALQTMHWLDLYKNEHLFSGDKLTNPSPIYELEMISDLYFPELDIQKSRVSSTCINYSQWVLKGAKEKSQTNSISQELIDEYKPIFEELKHSVSALLKKASEIMNELNSS